MEPNTTPALWNVNWPELIYPIEHRGVDFFVHLKQYAPKDLLTVLNRITSRQRIREGGLELVDDDPTEKEFTEFFWSHFIRFSGLKKPDGMVMAEEDILTWAKNRIRGISSLAPKCFGGITVDLDESEDPDLFSLEPTERIKTHQKLMIPETGKVERLEMTHNLRITESHFERWKKAQGTQRTDGKYAIRVGRNFEAIQDIYDGMMVFVDGMVNGDGPVQAAQVPFYHKLIVCTHAFREVERKN